MFASLLGNNNQLIHKFSSWKRGIYLQVISTKTNGKIKVQLENENSFLELKEGDGVFIDPNENENENEKILKITGQSEKETEFLLFDIGFEDESIKSKEENTHFESDEE